jgi:predicted GNAT family N-acyltransferase
VTTAFRVETLGSQHDRSGFSSGAAPLDRYFREQVTQDVRRRAAACYVAVDASSGTVTGYYTLSASGVALGEMPAPVAKRLPRYPLVPVARLGRLAIDSAYRGRGLGATLLWDTALRAARSELAVFAMVVGAKDDVAAAFYQHHGFVALGGGGLQLFLPLANILKP